jgi:hypothetical protein
MAERIAAAAYAAAEAVLGARILVTQEDGRRDQGEGGHEELEEHRPRRTENLDDLEHDHVCHGGREDDAVGEEDERPRVHRRGVPVDRLPERERQHAETAETDGPGCRPER